MKLGTDPDLTEAEDMASTLAALLSRVVMTAGDCLPDPARAAAVTGLHEWAGYCRPSCGHAESGECSTGDTDVCRCPCGHGERTAGLAAFDLLRRGHG